MLIDIGRLTELIGIRAEGDELVIGAATPHATLATSDLARADAPLLAHSAALGGSVVVAGPGATRNIAAEDFFTGFFETSLEPGELITAVRVPRRPGAAWGYQKFVRRANDWAIVGAAAIDGRIALANMGPTPLRARAAEQALADGASAAQAAELAAEGTEPGEDVHADRDYRRHLARVLTRRALEHRT